MKLNIDISDKLVEFLLKISENYKLKSKNHGTATPWKAILEQIPSIVTETHLLQQQLNENILKLHQSKLKRFKLQEQVFTLTI